MIGINFPTIKNMFDYVIYFAILAILPSLVLGDYFGKDYIHIFMVFGFGFIVYLNKKKMLFASDEETLIRFGFAIFVVALSGYFQQDPQYTRFAPGLDNFSKAFIPLVLLSILYFLKPRADKLLFLSICIGVLTALPLTVVGILENLPRGGGEVHGAPIIFGDLVMLYGLLSLVVAVYFFSSKKYLFSAIWCFIAVLGVFSSISSGTKGGLIALITLPFLFYSMISEKKNRYRFLLLMIILGLLFVLLVFGTNNLLRPRLFELWVELKMVLNGDLSGHTLGYRLQMWKYSWDLFLSHPIFGIGIGEFYSIKMHLIQNGLIDADIERFKHSHNEYLSIMSNMGLVGVFLYVWFFKWLISYFYHALKSSSGKVKYLGLTGLVTITCYLDFSLSESFLSSHLGGTAFFFIITLLIYSINQELVSEQRTNVSSQ